MVYKNMCFIEYASYRNVQFLYLASIPLPLERGLQVTDVKENDSSTEWPAESKLADDVYVSEIGKSVMTFPIKRRITIELCIALMAGLLCRG